MSMWNLLPEEIQVDILLRLLASSILACRCVCKFLFSLLSNPKFIKDHINVSIHNNKNPRLMFGCSKYDKGKNPIMNSIDYESISSSSSSKFKVVPMHYPFDNKTTKAIVTLGSCNGLICLGISSGGMGIEEKNCICIWSPSTGEYRNIKIPVCDFLPDSGTFCYVRYGFGYDNNINDYKLVRISGYENCAHVHSKEIQVYTLGGESKCWKTIQCNDDNYMLSGQLVRELPGVLINGSLHWSGSITFPTHGTSSRVIVCFDINNERLMDLPFPEEDKTILNLEPYTNVYREVGVLGDRLCLVFSVMDIRIDIWVMEDYGVRESCSKVFMTTGVLMTEDPFFKPIWSFENGGLLAYALGRLSLWDQNNGTTRRILLYGINMSRYPESYVESLVSLKMGTYVKKRTTNGNTKKPKRLRRAQKCKNNRVGIVIITAITWILHRIGLVH